jgi:cytochrome c biogenesis protein
VGGRTNRAQVAFEREFLEILDRISSQKDEKEVAIAATESLAS